MTDITGEAPTENHHSDSEHERKELDVEEEPTPNKEWITTTRATTKRPGDVDPKQALSKQVRKEPPKGEKRLHGKSIEADTNGC